MTDAVEQFAKDCIKLPAALKSETAYKDLKKSIDDMTEVLPIVKSLASDAIRDRHWKEILDISKKNIPYDSESFMLKDIFAVRLLDFRDDVEDIAEQAVKQLKLEKQLRDEISKYWEDAEIKIVPLPGKEEPSIITGEISEITEKLEEHMMQLN